MSMTDDEQRRDTYDPRTASGIRRSSIIYWVIVLAALILMMVFIWLSRSAPPPGAVPAPDTTSVPDTTVR